MEISPNYEEAIAGITRGKLHFKKERVGVRWTEMAAQIVQSHNNRSSPQRTLGRER